MNKRQIGGMSNMESMRRRLFDKLREIENDRDFVVGVMSSANSEEIAEAILNYIENGEDVTLESIILLSLEFDIANENQ